MYSDEREIASIRKSREASFESSRKVVPATIVSINSETTYSALGPNFTWVRIWGREESATPAYNPTTLAAAGTPVLVARSPKGPYRWTIISPDASFLTVTSSDPVSPFEMGPHAQNHQIPTEATAGSDPVYVSNPMMVMLKSEGDGSTLTVTTQPYIYIKDGVRQFFIGANTDLTSYVPGAGLKRKVLLYLNKNTGVLSVESGSTISSGSPLPAPSPMVPTGTTARESALIALTNGQTSVTTVTDIVDARDFLDGADANTALDTPTAEGQVLVTDETLRAIWVTPVIDENDHWMAGDNDQLVWE